MKTDVFEAILSFGRSMGAEWAPNPNRHALGLRSPLMWAWHDSTYYGAAHGLTGILFHALRYTDPVIGCGSGGGGWTVSDSDRAVVWSTVDYLLGRVLPTGNYPTRDDSSSDSLVQWCHGATAFALLFIRAYQIRAAQAQAQHTQSQTQSQTQSAAAGAKSTDSKSDSKAVTAATPPPPAYNKYLTAAVNAADVVWTRGLLKTKGVGLCHGVAGNAYVFLYLFHVTRELRWLYRAWCFAEFGLANSKVLYKNADAPLSFFNGISGWCVFLQELTLITHNHSHRPVWPGFDI